MKFYLEWHLYLSTLISLNHYLINSLEKMERAELECVGQWIVENWALNSATLAHWIHWPWFFLFQKKKKKPLPRLRLWRDCTLQSWNACVSSQVRWYLSPRSLRYPSPPLRFLLFPSRSLFFDRQAFFSFIHPCPLVVLSLRVVAR